MMNQGLPGVPRMVGKQQDATGGYRQKHSFIAATIAKPVYVRAAGGIGHKNKQNKRRRGGLETEKHNRRGFFRNDA